MTQPKCWLIWVKKYFPHCNQAYQITIYDVSGYDLLPIFKPQFN